ncbi:hypothetical protein P8452_66826 [Trifolium repens]|nr:hypothetical protein P8452_66826 [Trifolium repens]
MDNNLVKLGSIRGKKDMPFARIVVNCEPWIFQLLFCPSPTLLRIGAWCQFCYWPLFPYLQNVNIWPLHPGLPLKREVVFPEHHQSI